MIRCIKFSTAQQVLIKTSSNPVLIWQKVGEITIPSFAGSSYNFTRISPVTTTSN
ncbi:Uncharacterised protein [Vibrio cholerae]|nr:Uncharacterised protein [Vibrio cholerae]